MAKFITTLLALFLFFSSGAKATTFRIENQCRHTVWPGTLSGNNAGSLGGGGFRLNPGESMNLTVPPNWSGRIWGRTGCTFSSQNNNFKCATGDCGSNTINCTGGGAPPVTLVEFTTAPNPSEKDFYDVSLVDGYNVGMGVRALGGVGDCQYAGCVADLNAMCPPELRVTGDLRDGDDGQGGGVVACRSACEAFGAPVFCCTEEFATPQTCSPTEYSTMFKAACPTAYSYAYDDASSTCTCSGSDYLITFCPSA